MFTVARRDSITAALVSSAKSDDDVVGAAFVGSSATGKQDAWSDIDLMLQLAPGADEEAVIARWTAYLYTDFAVVHHLDVRAGNGVLYRVFLTAESLQMDISFWPNHEFRANGERFRVLFGTPNEPSQPPEPDTDAIIGQAWLFAIHIRSALARNTPWYAASLLDTMRIRIMELASIRCGLDPHQRREVDKLPSDYLQRLAQSYPASVTIPEITRAFVNLMDIYQEEIALTDLELSTRLAPALLAMIEAWETP